MKLLKKITHSNINNTTPAETKALVEAAGGEPVFICRVIGIVRGQEVVESSYGASIKFKGDFRGWGIDGEVNVAPVAYFPNPFDELLSNQINELQGVDSKTPVAVEFGLDLLAVPDKGTLGYKFICKPLVEVKASDPMAELEASFAPLPVKAAAPALGNDKQEALPTPEAEAPATSKAGKK